MRDHPFLINTSYTLSMTNLNIPASGFVCNWLFTHLFRLAQDQPRRPRTTRRAKAPGPTRGFTLIELFVVIGIVLVLVGLLVPKLATMRAGARNISKFSALREIGRATVVYANENPDSVPVVLPRAPYVLRPGDEPHRVQ